ncbi:MAG TPA: ABC transporter ATP-binding protein [Steroidobacteraceae bacterium]|jgi:putrescine transport system ATP-binding protein|nr:ABC transporter ATP-binding protein [Steroidobacteraceae bacterium]
MNAQPSTPPDPAAPYVRLQAVSKKFGEFAAVDTVSLDIRRGEIFCLLGGSGSGKTTLLRMLAGFERPSAGSIYIDGEDMSTVPPYDRPINMMFQSYALFPHMNVEKNVSFGLEQERLGRSEISRRVAEILEIVQMSPYAGRKPHQLSGGQRQRVALARALAKRPKLLLLDEPLAALDRKLRERTQFELRNIQERLGVTFIVVTHDQEEAMTLSTRMGVMDRGQIVQVGTPAEIYESPVNRFVADFIGSVNLLEGRVAALGADDLTIRCDAAGCTIRVGRRVECAPGDTVWAAIRPEKIALASEGSPDEARAENRVRGKVREVAYMGDVSICLVEIDSGKTFRVTLPNRSGIAAQRNLRHATVTLSWEPESPVILTR